MKTRQGFVSNSSTSSFVCNVCGEKFTGMDAGPSDFDCVECSNGHIMCNSHLKDLPPVPPVIINGCEHEFDRETMNFCPTCGKKATEVIAEKESDKYGYVSLHPSRCPVCRLEIYAEDEMSRYLEKTREITRDEVFAKVKEINKRRRKLYEAEYITYVCQKFELTDDILLKEIKERFESWDKYKQFIK